MKVQFLAMTKQTSHLIAVSMTLFTRFVINDFVFLVKVHNTYNLDNLMPSYFSHSDHIKRLGKRLTFRCPRANRHPTLVTFCAMLTHAWLWQTNFCIPAKGQLISKCLFGVFNSPKNWTKKFDFTTITEKDTPQLSALKEPGTSKLDWRYFQYNRIDRNELQIRKNLHKGTGTKMTDKLTNLTEKKWIIFVPVSLCK